MNLNKIFTHLPVWIVLCLLLAVAIPAAAVQDASTLVVWITWGDNPAQLAE